MKTCATNSSTKHHIISNNSHYFPNKLLYLFMRYCVFVWHPFYPAWSIKKRLTGLTTQMYNGIQKALNLNFSVYSYICGLLWVTEKKKRFLPIQCDENIRNVHGCWIIRKCWNVVGRGACKYNHNRWSDIWPWISKLHSTLYISKTISGIPSLLHA